MSRSPQFDLKTMGQKKNELRLILTNAGSDEAKQVVQDAITSFERCGIRVEKQGSSGRKRIDYKLSGQEGDDLHAYKDEGFDHLLRTLGIKPRHG